MKRLVTLVLALTMLVSFVPRAHSIGAFLSWWNGKDTDSGFGLGVNHQINIIPLFGADARLSWIGYSDKSINMVPLEAAGYANLGLFYAGLGIGYYFIDSDIDNEVGWFLLGGGKLGLAGISVFGELKYTFLKTDVNVGGSKSEFDASGFGINVGATLPF